MIVDKSAIYPVKSRAHKNSIDIFRTDTVFLPFDNDPAYLGLPLAQSEHGVSDASATLSQYRLRQTDNLHTAVETAALICFVGRDRRQETYPGCQQPVSLATFKT